MGYLDVINIITIVAWALITIICFPFFFFFFVGLFSHKDYPKAKEQLKYGVVIGARNEERVIGQLLDSIKASDYKKDLLTVFVVAHNCDDKTAEICKEKGAIVYEYNNSEERTVGFAYRYLFKQIEKDYGTSSFDGFFIINADNTLKKDFFSRMNDAFVYKEKKCVITGYRNSKNYGENYMSCLYGLFFMAYARFESNGRTNCNCSTRVAGTGYLFNSSIVKNGWNYVTLTEDWEFTADQICEGNKVCYCDAAVFYDEQPTTFSIMWRQRFRWAKGHMIVFFSRFGRLMKKFFGDGKIKVSIFDISLEILPLGLMWLAFCCLQLIAISLSPLFGYDPSVVWTNYLLMSAVGMGISYCLSLLSAVLLFITERKRMPKVGLGTKIISVLLWPFSCISRFLWMHSAFSKRKWNGKSYLMGKRDQTEIIDSTFGFS